MNINEIAKRAKVSTATVSRTINGSNTVLPQTAEKVWKVVHALGYQPSSYARALVSGRSHTLGLILSDIVNPFFPDLVKAFEETALQNGMEIIVANTGYDPERMLLGVRRMIERKVEGVAIMTSEMDAPLIEQLQTKRIPLVFLDTGKISARTSNIQVDYGQGIDEAVDHLVGLGHQKIGFITGPLKHASALDRRAAFFKSLSAHQLPRNRQWILEGNFQLDGGEKAMEKILQCDERPTAVLTSNDLTAIGAMRAAHRAGLRIPRDLSIIGFDDIAFCQLTQPQLTTIRLSREELAHTAFDALQAMIRKPKMQGCIYPLETRLVVRESTAHPAAQLNSRRK
jgi:LacI family transcriptional regulator